MSAVLLDALGWALLHSLWLGALTGLFYGAVRLSMSDRIELRYWLGVLSLFAIAASTIAVFARAILEEAASVASFAQSLASTSSAENGVALAQPDVFAEAQAQAQAQSFQLFEPGSWSTGSLTVWVSLLWLVGVGISAYRLWRSHHALHELAARAEPDVGLKLLVRSLLVSLKMQVRVRIALSDLIDVPCVIGVLRPMILMPAALVARLPQDQLELVILHELTHIKNGDLWVNAGQIAIEVLMFFHPVVRWISADVRAMRERRCDRDVLRLRATPMCYAKTLLSLEEYRHEFRGLAMAANGGDLTRRVRDILSPRSHRLSARRSGRGAAMISAVGVSAICAAILGYNTTVPEPKLQEPILSSSSAAPVIAKPEVLIDDALAQSAPEPAARTAVNRTQEPAALARIVPITEVSSVPAARVLRSAKMTLASRLPLQLTEPLFAPIANPALPVPVSQPNLPKLLHRVNPSFMPGNRSFYRFSLSFSLDAQGRPQAIELASGSASSSQLAAAKTALAQWRFDPAQSADFAGTRVEQSFSFKEIVNRVCTPVVGTRICRF